jgi:hypothetical protein
MQKLQIKEGSKIKMAKFVAVPVHFPHRGLDVGKVGILF